MIDERSIGWLAPLALTHTRFTRLCDEYDRDLSHGLASEDDSDPLNSTTGNRPQGTTR